MNNNLSLIGYRMPAEWELQESVWIAWPYNKSDWPGLFKNIPKIVTQIISELSRSQKINLLIDNYKDNKFQWIKYNYLNIKFFKFNPSNDKPFSCYIMDGKNKFEINHRVTNKDIKIINYVYFLKNDKNVSLSTENWYNLAKINVGIPKYFDKAIKVYRSEYEKDYVQKIEKRG